MWPNIVYRRVAPRACNVTRVWLSTRDTGSVSPDADLGPTRRQAVSTTPGPGEHTTTIVDRLGIERGMVVQELGYDDDVDHDLREAIEKRLDDEMVDEDSDEVVDVVLLWFRYDD